MYTTSAGSRHHTHRIIQVRAYPAKELKQRVVTALCGRPAHSKLFCFLYRDAYYATLFLIIYIM